MYERVFVTAAAVSVRERLAGFILERLIHHVEDDVVLAGGRRLPRVDQR